ncbi:hypothetical protein AMAG_20000 [Allomyces macrogynus ATCC 38327]|uniref:PH domain-containing protein n=1 Tax=Allomyces macrogynus (strain ATCC 38327) TaxID=578462 RepID=A0A0L0T4D2_ALLM3|nr:hypothetical protein AMAG_20000 [Allomyces macrogynus ATCC 38327]|eukprot:KNE69592.1 hypothetical protein AMAG_20000 [Allomyces macrogynus ATCC 38327]
MPHHTDHMQEYGGSPPLRPTTPVTPPPAPLPVGRTHGHLVKSSGAHDAWRAATVLLPPPASTFLTRPPGLATQLPVLAHRPKRTPWPTTSWSPRWLVIDHVSRVLHVYKEPAALLPVDSIPLASSHVIVRPAAADRLVLEYLSTKYQFRAAPSDVFPGSPTARFPSDLNLLAGALDRAMRGVRARARRTSSLPPPGAILVPPPAPATLPRSMPSRGRSRERSIPRSPATETRHFVDALCRGASPYVAPVSAPASPAVIDDPLPFAEDAPCRPARGPHLGAWHDEAVAGSPPPLHARPGERPARPRSTPPIASAPWLTDAMVVPPVPAWRGGGNSGWQRPVPDPFSDPFRDPDVDQAPAVARTG